MEEMLAGFGEGWEGRGGYGVAEEVQVGTMEDVVDHAVHVLAHLPYKEAAV